MTDDWADAAAYELIKEAVTACDDSYSTDYAKVATALRKAKADGMREAAEFLKTRLNNIEPDDPYRNKDLMHCLAMDDQDAITKSHIGYLEHEASKLTSTNP